MFFFILGTLILSFRAVSQETAPEKRGADVSINFVTGITRDEFKENYDKSALLGFNFDVVFIPFKNAKAWKPGGQFEIFFGGQQKDQWSGIQLTSQSAFLKLNFINRFQPPRPMVVKPFLELAYGFNLNTTSSSYEVVDKASFWERFLLNAEDLVETKTAKEYSDITHNLAIGAGIIIKNFLVLQVKYNYVPEIEYVKADGITVVDNRIVYDFAKSDMKLITIGLGITFNTKTMKSNKVDDDD